MIRHPVIGAMVKQNLVNEVEGHYLEYLLHSSDNSLDRAIAIAGFTGIAPFFHVLEQEVSQGIAAGETGCTADPLITNMTFNTMAVKAAGNQSAVEFALRFCRGSMFQSNFLIIYGAEGQGKTHLLSAAGHETQKGHPERRIMMVSMLDLAIALIRAGRCGSRDGFMDFLSRIDILLIDDIQLCEADVQVQADLLEVINRQLGKPEHRLFCTCDIRPTGLRLNEARLRVAIEGSTMVEIRTPDEIDSSLISPSLAKGSYFPADILNYTMKNTRGGIREKKAAAMLLAHVAMSVKREVGLELADTVLSGMRQGPSSGQRGIRDEGGMHAPGASPAGRTNHDSQLLKDLIRSAESKEDRALANQIVLSQMTKKLSSRKSADVRPMRARLQLALQAIRDADTTTASGLMNGYSQAGAGAPISQKTEQGG